jgi:hypothetical protein
VQGRCCGAPWRRGGASKSSSSGSSSSRRCSAGCRSSQQDGR